MPPPSSKLHNKTGKHKKINKHKSEHEPLSTNISPSVVTNNSSSLGGRLEGNVDIEQQLEVEICWCIQSLESSLLSGKLNAKQALDTEKTIKLLSSPNQPVIKKRQIMRAAFGDYRAKMTEEQKKMRLKGQQIQFTRSAAPVKSHFVKKSVLQTLGNEFKFNFPMSKLHIQELDLNDSSSNTDNAKDLTVSIGTKSDLDLVLIPSNNSFKFNFNVE